VRNGSIAQARLLWHLRHGLLHIEWGLDEIRKIFLSKITRNAGELRVNDSVQSISMSWFSSKIEEIEMLNSRDRIGAGLVALAMNPMMVPDLIQGKKANELRKEFDQYKPTHYLFTVNLGLMKGQIPEGMGRIVLNIHDPSKRLHGANFLIIQQNPAMTPEQPASGLESLSVTAFLPAKRFDGTIQTLSSFGNEVISTLIRDVMPFLNPETVVQSIAAIRIGPDGQPVIDSRSLIPVYPPETERGLGLFRIPVKTKYKTILNLGMELVGSMGFEGNFYMAREALKMTFEHIKQRGNN
jgi:hypothetical protein